VCTFDRVYQTLSNKSTPCFFATANSISNFRTIFFYARKSTIKRTHLVCFIPLYQVVVRVDQELQHIATHCSTLQHTATRCNTLQHTATYMFLPNANNFVFWTGKCAMKRTHHVLFITCICTITRTHNVY